MGQARVIGVKLVYLDTKESKYERLFEVERSWVRLGCLRSDTFLGEVGAYFKVGIDWKLGLHLMF